MKKGVAFVSVILFFIFSCSGSKAVIKNVQKPTVESQYVWKSVIAGGGGFIDGIIFHPREKDLVYLRTDMGGAYRWNKEEKKWMPITDMFNRLDADNTGILSLAIDVNDVNRVYLMTGKYTQDWAGMGVLLISKDRGEKWESVKLPFKVGGNEDGRGCGERLAVDPNKPSILFAGSTRNGLWKSVDYGKTWNNVASFKPQNVNFVFFDGAGGKKGTETKRIFVAAAENSKSLYVSEDAGNTWTLLKNHPENLMAIRADKNGDNLFVTFSDHQGPNGATMGAVYKYNITQKTWTDLKAPEGSGGFSGISVYPKNPDILAVSTLDRWGEGDEVFLSIDCGKTWRPTLKNAKWDYSYAPYVSHEFKPHWIADVKIDPFNPDHAMFVTGYGLWATTNFQAKTVVWFFNDENLEQTVPLQIISPPSGKAHLLSACGDVDGFRYEEDFSKSPPDRHMPPRWTTLSIACAWQNPDKMVKTFNKPPYGAYSIDNGITWTDFAKKPQGAKNGGGTRSIAISADGKSIVWYPEKSDAVYYSMDDGKTWNKSGGGVSPARPLADTVNPKKFYVYDSTTGKMWVSDNYGRSFSKKSGEFAYVLKWTVDDCMAAVVPGFENCLWVTADTQGLYYTHDAGNTAIKVDNVEEAYRIGFGMAAPGNDYPSVFIHGKINGIMGFYRSDDIGKTWVRINDDRHQYGWVHCIIGDPRVFGRCYLAVEGRGVIYGEMQ
ncbi:MAG: endoglucanase [Candidatus Goldbacteria bacterium]|nr:endoglucanase [Candidatus Goldiibacteriota bacterium]